MKINREDVVQAALILERWCAYHWKRGVCDVECPFIRNDLGDCKIGCLGGQPFLWGLEEFLRSRGLKHD